MHLPREEKVVIRESHILKHKRKAMMMRKMRPVMVEPPYHTLDLRIPMSGRSVKIKLYTDYNFKQESIPLN